MTYMNQDQEIRARALELAITDIAHAAANGVDVTGMDAFDHADIFYAYIKGPPADTEGSE